MAENARAPFTQGAEHLQQARANYGTHCSKWECSHRLQTTSKGLHANLLTRCCGVALKKQKFACLHVWNSQHMQHCDCFNSLLQVLGKCMFFRSFRSFVGKKAILPKFVAGGLNVLLFFRFLFPAEEPSSFCFSVHDHVLLSEIQPVSRHGVRHASLHRRHDRLLRDDPRRNRMAFDRGLESREPSVQVSHFAVNSSGN